MAAFTSTADSVMKLSSIFSVLDDVRDEMAEVSWGVPKIIVFGAESTGKSTIMERIAMMPIFPEGKKLCTRMAVEVRLRYKKQDTRTAVIGLYKDDKISPEGWKTSPLNVDSEEGKKEVRRLMEYATTGKGQGEGRTVDKEQTIR